MSAKTQTTDRREDARMVPTSPMRITKAVPLLPIHDATVINVSAHGIAISTHVPLHEGERLSVHVEQGMPPVLVEVLACERIPGGLFRLRCRCLLGGFEELVED